MYTGPPATFRPTRPGAMTAETSSAPADEIVGASGSSSQNTDESAQGNEANEAKKEEDAERPPAPGVRLKLRSLSSKERVTGR